MFELFFNFFFFFPLSTAPVSWFVEERRLVPVDRRFKIKSCFQSLEDWHMETAFWVSFFYFALHIKSLHHPRPPTF
ncbi:hypothetical protein CC78DRAFT_171015 [Lojkania enalia]|uniref:Secreted protein n=1 Tax=Lojkania enalia TaxID=147567 RepID=A0A9P4JXX2_9PLEO|nr:hypothetical protein CC78DRAFT_171015 [Didymosphaeria enalia]